MNGMLLDILWSKEKGKACAFSFKEIDVFEATPQSLSFITQIIPEQEIEEILIMFEDFQFHSVMTGAAIVFEQVIEEFGTTKHSQYICVNGIVVETQKIIDLLREWDMEPYRTMETMDSDLNEILSHYSHEFNLSHHRVGDEIVVWKRIPAIDKLTLEEKFINIMKHDRYDNDNNSYKANSAKKYCFS